MSAAEAGAQPLRILRIIARLNVGGPARHVVLLNRGLQERGHQTLLAYGSLDEGEASFEHAAEEAAIPSAKIPDLGRRLAPYGDLRALLQLLRLAFRERPDVIHTHTAKAGALGRLAALAFNATRSRRRRCIVVHTFHGHVFHGYFSRPVNLLVRLIERALARVTTRIVAISPLQRSEIVGRFGIAPARRTVVIPLGLNLSELLALAPAAPDYRRRLSIGSADVVVGYVGRMVPIKDLSTLVRAFGRAYAGNPALWLLLSGDGPVRESLLDAARESGVLDRVRFLGWTEDLAGLYSTMDICALSSLNEGTPVALIEAMAAGRPVVATAVGGVPDVVEDGVTGILVPPGDAGALASAICRLASDPQERSAMGAAARRLVATRYVSERLVEDVERLYRSALAETRAGRS